ncbi:hypothetical protein K402DRAFT_463029 [Aulographum hederae CBS 113979]|uniref:Uncharacterized protein n=1 Tax=Aulographum hederae CBS 113979 TaxID=1176131 RepID=A0A6G1H2P4_9PEZI|nr:hypothetical protein K402DRAFT_463029 [Aulographum hederae CBS 113979]
MAEPDPDDDGEGPANPSQTESPDSPLDVAQFYERSQLFNPALYKKKTVNEFIDYVLNSYKVGGLNDEVLTEQFCEDFAMFDRSNRATVDKSRLAMIKLNLRNNGCYVPTGTKRGTPADLEDVIKNSLQWPFNDPKCLAYIINKVYERQTVFKSQQKQTSCIRLLESTFTKEDYVKQRALGAYIATASQPEASFALSYAAQITEPTWDDAQFLNRCLQNQISAPGLRFVPLNEASLRLIAYTDSSFANNRDYSSKSGYVIVLADKDGNANIIHWHPQGKSTLRIPMTLCVDSKSLYDCLVKLGTTQEKRLMIDILCLRQSAERREISEILWIKGEKNPADTMTKVKHFDALKRLITTNKVDLDHLNGLVDREGVLDG